MPRMSEAEKQKSHRRIIDAAARLVREKGVDATSVSDVMKEAGLTHGGFYRHFASKEDLVAAAFRHAVDEVVREVETAPSGEARDAERDAYIANYLSARHVKDRGHGCPLTALAADLARVEGAPRGAAASAVGRMARLLGAEEKGEPAQGFALMALLLGSVALARLAETGEEADRVLDAGQAGVQILQRHWSPSRE